MKNERIWSVILRARICEITGNSLLLAEMIMRNTCEETECAQRRLHKRIQDLQRPKEYDTRFEANTSIGLNCLVRIAYQ